MVRKSLQTLLSLMVMAPAASWAVGLGDIKLHSALNQPMNAEIELLSVDSTSLDTMRAQLASYESFAQVGVDRAAVLMFLQFSVESDASGRAYIKVTSDKPIREPFLDFLVEVDWRSGRLLREYTVLLDPPEMMKEAPASVAAPQVTYSPTGVSSAPSRTVSTSQQMAGGMQYGPTRDNDTLWQIAERMRTDNSVSIYQMMMALYQANPDAFIDNNINRLKKGRILRIDDPALIAAMSREEASREFARQTRAWEEYKNRAGMAATQRPSAEGAEAPAMAVAPKEDAKLKLVVPETGKVAGAAPGSGEGDAVQQDLMMALEDAEALRRENQELNSRLEKLESQLEAVQRLLVLKEDDLAQMQQQLGQGAQTEALQPAQPPAVESQVKATEAKPAEKPVEPAPAVAQSAAPAEKPKAAAPAEKPAPAKPKKVVPPPAPAPEPGIMDMVFENIALIGGGLAGLIALIGGLIFMRRRNSNKTEQESILTARTSSMMQSGISAEEAAGESSFLSDLAISGLEEVQGAESSEADALTEADVYMAYGRYQQAEDLLNDAIGKHPGNMDLVAKLLEVHHSTKSPDKFTALVEQHKDKLEANDGLWKKIIVMGFALVPSNALFKAAEGMAPAAAEPPKGHDDLGLDDDILDIGLDLDALTAEMESDASDEAMAGGDDFADLDFGLDLGGEAESAEEPVAESAGEMEFEGLDELSSDDLDMGGLDLDLGSVDEEPAAAEESMEFDLGAGAEALAELDEPMAFEAEEKVEEPAAADTGFDDFDLDAAFAELGGDEDVAAVSNDLDELGDLDDLEGDLMGDQDEISTKLDLARAYIEMDDSDSARQMLEEVVKEGNATQQDQAKKLLENLG